MNKIFAPLGRWKFVFYTFLVYIISSLYTNFVMFFDMSGISGFYMIGFLLIFLFLLVFKRARDIFYKPLKSIVFTIISIVLYFVFCILSYPTVSYTIDDIAKNKFFLLLYTAYSILLILFLALKNNKNTKFINLELKAVVKRIVLLLSLLFICKMLTFNFNTTLPQIDYRMYPTLELHDKLLVKKITRSTSLNREDIVCIKNSNGLPKALRVIGLPNENIKLDGKKIYINNKLYSDKYAFYSKNLKQINLQETIPLDKDSFLLIGDNRYYDKNGEILTVDKHGYKNWNPIEPFKSTQLDTSIYLILNKNELFGKVIAIHYEKMDIGKYEKVYLKRNKTNYSIALKNNKFGFNPSSRFEKIFGTIK